MLRSFLVAGLLLLLSSSAYAVAEEKGEAITPVPPPPMQAARSVPTPEVKGPPAAESETLAQTDATVEPESDSTSGSKPESPSIEEQLRSLQKQVDALSAKKPDTWPSVRFTAELQADLIAAGQDATNFEEFGEIPDGTAFRRARVGWFGDWRNTSYRIEFDFALPGRPSFLDVWGEIRELPVVGNFRIGHFFEPSSIDRLTPNRFITFMERSLIDQAFVPARNLGAMFYNWNERETMTWAVGVFRPNSDEYGDQVGSLESQALTARVTGLPWWDAATDGRGYFHLGGGYSFRLPNNEQVRFRAQPEIRIGSAVPNIPFFVDTGVFDAENYQLIDFETVLTLGSFSTQAELYYVPVDQIGGPSLSFWGGYAQASYFLTGEYRPYNRRRGVLDRVVPLEDFFVLKKGSRCIAGTGAWEVATRVSYIDLDDQNIQGGELLNLTMAVNWHLNLYMRASVNYIHSFLDDPPYGPSNADFFGARFQYEF